MNIVKLEEWNKVAAEMDSTYYSLIETKQKLCTEFEIIMDTKSRNQYHIKNRSLNYNNRLSMHGWDKKEVSLTKNIDTLEKENGGKVILLDEDLDNWDDEL